MAQRGNQMLQPLFKDASNRGMMDRPRARGRGGGPVRGPRATCRDYPPRRGDRPQAVGVFHGFGFRLFGSHEQIFGVNEQISGRGLSD
jgi:hypothetical protein